MESNPSVHEVLNTFDTLSEILLLLPPEETYKLILVSKRWLQIISSPFFRHAYLARWKPNFHLIGFFISNTSYVGKKHVERVRRPRSESSMPLLSTSSLGDEVETSGALKKLGYYIDSSNGVLLCGRHPKAYYLWDPVTRKQHKIPRHRVHFEEVCMSLITEDCPVEGFSYKVVRGECVSYAAHSNKVRVEIYSSKTTTWSYSELVCNEAVSLTPWTAGRVIKGVVYWHATGGKVAIYDTEDEEKKIDVIKLPKTFNYDEQVLGESSDGCLQYGWSNKSVMEIWKLEKVGEVLEWSIQFKVNFKAMWRLNPVESALLCKGADNVMFERLSKNGREFEEETRDHVNEYADAGLRTLILAYRELDEKEYKVFSERISEAKSSVSADRESLIEQVTGKVEKDLILLGATAVEDKLQNGVPDCIDKLAQAGIKIWVLTGDKMETAINIGFACSLLRQDMKQIIINLETPEIHSLEKTGEKDAIAKASKESVLLQIINGKAQLKYSGGGNSNAFALIIDGKSLAYALDDDVKHIFLELAVGCASVICCRSSPKQKALVTRLVKSGNGKTTLAIGDGANDVGMLQEADIGVGISGVEGMQAVMSSDIAIAQFRYLERLLLVHGHWCYRRISTMVCYFFYKNITFGFTLFLYEAYTTFSATPAYNDWFLSLYNVCFSSLPVIALGVFDQDVSARYCLKFPLLYQEGVQNVLFSWRRILGWMFNGFYSAVIIFFLCKTSLEPQAFNHQGKTPGREILGGTMYTCIVWVVNLQMALAISYFTLIQHIVIWGSILVWYLFITVYGELPAMISTGAYRVFVEALAPSLSYWVITLFVVVSTLLPYFVYSAVQMRFFPMYHGMIQWLRYEGQCNDPEYCDMVRQRSIRPTTVGFTARLEAKRRSVRRSESI